MTTMEVPVELIGCRDAGSRDLQWAFGSIEWLKGTVGHGRDHDDIAALLGLRYIVQVLLRSGRENAASIRL